MGVTRWTEGHGAQLAYQVTGEGQALLVQPDWLTSLEVDETYWRPQEFFRGLADVGRVIRVDARGSGLSDAVLPSSLPTAEVIADDTIAVLDALGLHDVVVIAGGEGGLLGMVLAATHPDRVRGLVLVNAFATYCSRSPGDPGPPCELVENALVEARAAWGTGYSAEFWNPDMAADPEYVEWLARWQRTVAGPSVAFALFRLIYLELDVRPVLPTITAPTLVLHRRDCTAISFAHGEELARQIPNASLHALPGADGVIWGVGADDVIAEIAEFVTGTRPPPPVERVLATVLFTDIVGSTQTASRLGDAAWRQVLDRHDAIATRQVANHRGRLIKSTGDGIVATFDGPGRAIQCAKTLREELANHGVTIRAGLHAGEIELRGSDIGGIGVHIASRVQTEAAPGETVVTRTVVDLVAGSAIEFDDRGQRELKGVPGRWQLFAVRGDVARPNSR